MRKLLLDWDRNENNIKGKILTISFRMAHIATRNKVIFFLLIPYLIFYRVIIEWFLGVELPYKTKIGKGLIIYHGHSLVVNDGTVLGDNCTLRHCTTLGNKMDSNGLFSKCPTIGNNVDIGSNVCVIGPINIGNNVIIGAGSVVVKDVPSNSIIVGNPARIIKTILC